MSTHRDRMRLRDEFHAAFAAESAKRRGRAGFVAGEPEWVVLEREAMLRLVNLHRARLKKGPVDVAMFTNMEGRCVGHSDYHPKLALGCMELVLDER